MQEEAKLIESKAVYEFDAFRVDAANRQLLRAGEVVPLTAKVFDILLLFVENHGRLLQKDEVMQRVWQQSFVEEGNLTRHVSTLRKALGEDSKSHQYIVTVTGYGYKFVAPVREVQDTDALMVIAEQTVSTTVIEEEISPPPVTNAPRLLIGNPENATTIETKKWRRILLIVAAACLVALVVTALLILRKERPASPPSNATVKSIAVLPLKPLNVENRDPVYELGIADSLILKLSGVKEIIVRPLSATRKYTNLEQDPLIAGREQQVDYVLSPSYQLADGKIRITAQLFNIKDGSVSSVFKCDESCTDIFATQDAISEKVGRLLLTHLTNEQNNLLARHYTDNQEAYRLYLQGRYFWDKRTEKGFEQAMEYFKKASELDPNYALAYAGLADTYLFRLLPRNEAMPKARAYAEKALDIDEALAEAHTSLAFVKMNYEFDWSGAEGEFKRAIELNPNYSVAHQFYGVCLVNQGRTEEGLHEARRALELDPLSLAINWSLGLNLYHARQYDQAIEQLRKTLQMEPNYHLAQISLGSVYLQKGLYAEAISKFQTAHKLQEEPNESLSLLAYAYAVSGNRSEAQKRLGELKKVPPDDLSLLIARIYTGLGDKQEAIAWLEKAYQVRDFTVFFLKVDPTFDSLRADTRFAGLLRRVGLTPYAERNGLVAPGRRDMAKSGENLSHRLQIIKGFRRMPGERNFRHNLTAFRARSRLKTPIYAYSIRKSEIYKWPQRTHRRDHQALAKTSSHL